MAKPLSELSAAELDRLYAAYDAMATAKAALVRGADAMLSAGTLERYRPQVEALGNLVEAAWDNTMGPHWRDIFDALEAAEKRKDEAAREAERQGAA